MAATTVTGGVKIILEQMYLHSDTTLCAKYLAGIRRPLHQDFCPGPVLGQEVGEGGAFGGGVFGMRPGIQIKPSPVCQKGRSGAGTLNQGPKDFSSYSFGIENGPAIGAGRGVNPVFGFYSENPARQSI